MTIQFKKSFSLSRIGLATIAAFAFQSLSTQAAVLVEWGLDGDIVTDNNQDSSAPTGTYTSGNTVTPAVSASYYPNNTGKNPSFNGAVTGGGDLENWNGGSNDFFSYPRFSSAGQTTTALTMWEGGLHMTPSGQGQLNTFLIRPFMRNGADSGTIRFVFEQNDSDWYISDPFAFTNGGNSFLLNAGEANWYDYTPLSGGSDIIGALATPTLDYTAVGFRSTVTRDAGAGNGWSAVRVSQFQVTTGSIPEPSVVNLLGISFGILFASRRMRRR